VLTDKHILVIIRRPSSHVSERNNVSRTFSLEPAMTDDKSFADNVNGVEDKSKCCYNLWGVGAAMCAQSIH
jgi:hypothetical protein